METFRAPDIEENRSRRKIKGKKRRRQWEQLGERGPVSIDTISAGLVSGAVGGKDAPNGFDIKALGSALRGGLRTAREGFDPNAIDGDNDGLVQDGTAFERPDIPHFSRGRAETIRFQQAGSANKRFASWLADNPGFASEVSGPHRVALAQKMRKEGKSGFASRSSSMDKDIRDAIVRLLDDIKPPKNGDKRLIFVGGTIATGKSTLINRASKNSSLINLDGILFPNATEAAFIDPDEIKLHLDGYDFGRGAQLVHEDSREIADAVMAEAMRRNLSIVVQGTGRGTGYLTDARQKGYKTHGVIAWVPEKIAKQRLADRNANNAINGGPQFDEEFQSMISSSLQDFLADQIDFDLYDELIALDTSEQRPRRIFHALLTSRDDERLKVTFDDKESAETLLGFYALGAINKKSRPKVKKSSSVTSSETGNKTNPSSQNLSASFIDVTSELDKPTTPKIIFGAGIPVTVQHVTEREYAKSIVKDGFQPRPMRLGAHFGEGFYFNVEGSGWGYEWSEYSNDPVFISATFRPNNPLIIGDPIITSSELLLSDVLKNILKTNANELLSVFKNQKKGGTSVEEVIKSLEKFLEGDENVLAGELLYELLHTDWVRKHFDSLIVEGAHYSSMDKFDSSAEIIVFDPSIVKIIGTREFASDAQWEQLKAENDHGTWVGRTTATNHTGPFVSHRAKA